MQYKILGLGHNEKACETVGETQSLCQSLHWQYQMMKMNRCWSHQQGIAYLVVAVGQSEMEGGYFFSTGKSEGWVDKWHRVQF
jgi:hypothetical protein